MKIKYAVSRKDERHSLVIEDANDSLLFNIFAMMNGDEPGKDTLKKSEVLTSPSSEAVITPKKNLEKPTEKTPSKMEIVVHREHSGVFSMADKFKTASISSDKAPSFEIPESSRRKVMAGEQEIEVFKTKVICPSCGSKHDRFSSPDNTYAKCRQCNEKLKLERAMPNFMEPNAEGYLFTATRK